MISTLYLFRPAISYGVSVSVDNPGDGSSEDVGMTLSSHNQTIMPSTTTTTTRQLQTAPQHAADCSSWHITSHSTYHQGMLSLGVALMCSFSLLNWTGLASMLTICNSIWFGHGSGHWKAEQKALLLGLFIIITFNWGISWLQSYCVQCYAFVNTLTKAVQVPWWEHDVWIVLPPPAPAATLHPPPSLQPRTLNSLRK